MNLRVIFLCTVLLLVGGFAVGLYQYSQKMIRVLEGPENRAPIWDLARVQKKMVWSRQRFDDAKKILATYEFATAHTLFSEQTMEPIQHYFRWYPTNTVQTGVTFQAWVDLRRQDYLDEMKTQFSLALDALETGRINPERIQSALNLYTNTPALQQTYESRIGSIKQSRLTQATNAVRLRISGADKARWMEKTIEEKILKTIDPKSKQLIYIGDPLSEEEAAAVPRTLTVDLTIDYATYKVKRFSSFSNITWEPTKIPAFAKLKINFSGSEAMMSTWDAIESIEVMLKPPEVVSESTQAEFIRRFQNALSEEVGKKLEAIPAFSEMATPKEFLPK